VYNTQVGRTGGQRRRSDAAEASAAAAAVTENTNGADGDASWTV